MGNRYSCHQHYCHGGGFRRRRKMCGYSPCCCHHPTLVASPEVAMVMNIRRRLRGRRLVREMQFCEFI